MDNNLQFIGDRNNAENLVLFIHGFTGSVDTWSRPDVISFPELLVNDEGINGNFDVAHFEYFTRLLDLYSKVESGYRRVLSLVSKRFYKTQKNISITEIANLLRNIIRFQLGGYKNIIIIAHSMGGLVAKQVIADECSEGISSRIKLFISLAVPHQGAEHATLGALVCSNIQIEQLRPINKFITELSQKWVSLQNKPSVKYFYGTSDSIVTKESAISIDNQVTDVIAVNEDHLSITKPESDESLVFVAVKELLSNFLDDEHKLEATQYQRLDDEASYNDELFVLKLLVADVHQSTVRDCKELFLNAEYMRKFLKTEDEQAKLESLYDKIRLIYKDSYNKFINGSGDTSGQLVAEVHEKITDQDEKLLKSLSAVVQAFHKQGMLHQLANYEQDDIWWTEDKSLETEGD